MCRAPASRCVTNTKANYANGGIEQKHTCLQREKGNLFRKHHEDYLASKSWAEKRAKVMKRANRLCEGCRDRKATIVHHLSYERWGDELLFDLVALCRTCHAKCHPEKQEDEKLQGEPPCYACRHHAWNIEDRLWCGKFETTAVGVLGADGPCGPAGAAQESLK
jgi:hypothetical protein